MGAFGTLGSGRGLWARRVPGSEPGVQAEARGGARPSVGRKPLSDHQGPGEWRVSGGAGARRPRAGGCARSRLCRRSGRNHSCSRSARSCTAARAGSALGTRLCLVVGVTGVDLARARAPEPHRPLSFWSGWVLQDPTPTAAPPTSPASPGRALTDTACSGGVKLETAGTLAHCSAWPRYAATANATALVRILLRAVLFCAGQENRKLTPPQRWPQPRLCPLPLCSPRGGFPKSRGLASQKELLSLCDVGHWDPGRGDQWSVWSMHPDFHPHTPSDRSVPAPSRLTSTARRARAALGAPTAALATAAVIEGEGGPSKGARAHAILFSLTPAHIPPLRGSLCGGGPGVREESKLNQERPACAPTHSRGGCSPRAPHGRQGPGVGPGRPSPSPAGLSGSWQSRPEGPGTQGRRHSQR